MELLWANPHDLGSDQSTQLSAHLENLSSRQHKSHPSLTPYTRAQTYVEVPGLSASSREAELQLQAASCVICAFMLCKVAQELNV